MEKKLSSTSGAAKRRKLKETKATLAKLPKLTTFLKPIEKRAETEAESQNSAEVVCINQSVEHDDIEENIATGNKNMNEEDVNRSPRNHRNEDQEDSNSDTNDAIEQINLEKSSELFSTDIANFHGKILTKDIKKIIVLSESCRPKGPFIRDPLQENRRFSKKYFKTTTKYGSIERMWLCYSPKLMPFIVSLVGFSQKNEKQRITGVSMVSEIGVVFLKKLKFTKIVNNIYLLVAFMKNGDIMKQLIKI